MSKQYSYYICEGCGYRTTKWMGKCPQCGEWETFVEEIVSSTSGVPQRPLGISVVGDKNIPLSYDSIKHETQPRFSSDIEEFDRVLGGGIVPGSLVLVGGEPGIGKSTLMLQVAGALSAKGKKVLYVSGEESVQQLKLRGERLGIFSPSLYVVAETTMEHIENHVKQLEPVLVVVDSIQTVYSSAFESLPGSISQVRECATRFLFLAKSTGIPFFLVGHITKGGTIAGPKTLEHVVDTVLYFEGEGIQQHRIIRAIKNRFGPTSELAIFEMTTKGLMSVENPSSIFLAQRKNNTPGSAVICCLEGSRPLLVEVQALVSVSNYSVGRRMAQGYDRNRISLLMAMLEKVAGYDLLGADVYLNMVGGIYIAEPAADLGVVSAIASSFMNKPVDPTFVLIGEVGLGGEVRAVPQLLTRVKEAAALGFSKCFVPDGKISGDLKGIEIQIHKIKTVNKLFDYLF